MIDVLAQYLPGFIALIVSIAAFIGTQRGISSRARADAVGQVEGKITQLNEKLEAEVQKLHLLLDRCIKERVGFKDSITNLEKALKRANIELAEWPVEAKEAGSDVELT